MVALALGVFCIAGVFDRDEAAALPIIAIDEGVLAPARRDVTITDARKKPYFLRPDGKNIVRYATQCALESALAGEVLRYPLAISTQYPFLQNVHLWSVIGFFWKFGRDDDVIFDITQERRHFAVIFEPVSGSQSKRTEWRGGDAVSGRLYRAPEAVFLRAHAIVNVHIKDDGSFRLSEKVGTVTGSTGDDAREDRLTAGNDRQNDSKDSDEDGRDRRNSAVVPLGETSKLATRMHFTKEQRGDYGGAALLFFGTLAALIAAYFIGR